MIFLIRKIFSFVLLVLFLSHWSAALALNHGFEMEGAIRIEQDLQQAINCIPQASANGYLFCNGLKLNKKQYRTFKKLDLQSCQQQITKQGYKIFYKAPEQAKDDFLQFTNSTARALAVHDKTLVFFRSDVSAIDCLHELLHVYQRSLCSKSRLCPNTRALRSKQILDQLNDGIAKVEEWERKGQKELAKQYADSMQPSLKLYQRFEDTINWLDEKDVHYFIYQHCDELKCSLEDKEVALANLFKLRNYFPARYLSYIRQEAANVVQLKKDLQRQSLLESWKKIDAKKQLAIDSITPETIMSHFSMPYHEAFWRVMVPQVRLSLGEPFIDLAQFSDLPLLSVKEEERFPLINIPDFDGAQFLCSDKLKPEFVLGTKTSYFSLLREVYTYYAALANPHFCQLMLMLPKLKSDFSNGLVSREFFEGKLVESMIYRDYIRQLFGQWLLSRPLAVEQYKHLLLQLSEFLLPHADIPNKRVTGKKYPSYSLLLDRSLPYLKSGEQVYIFDTGAMNSIMPPSFIERELLNKAQWIKNITFMLTDGRKVDAPYLFFDNSSEVDKLFAHPYWAVVDLQLPSVQGVLGLDWLKNKNFIIDLKKGILQITPQLKTKSARYMLVPEYDGSYRALEFLCPDSNSIVRLDTGSEVEADISPKLAEQMTKGTWTCGNLKKMEKPVISASDSVLFSREVVVNYGWEWAKRYSRIQVSLTEGWISFEEDDEVLKQ